MYVLLAILASSLFLISTLLMQPIMANNKSLAKLKCAAIVMYSYSNASKACYLAVMKEHCSNSKAARNSFHPHNIDSCPHIKQSLQQSKSLKKIKWKKSANIIASCLKLVGQEKGLLERYKRKCNK